MMDDTPGLTETIIIGAELTQVPFAEMWERVIYGGAVIIERGEQFEEVSCDTPS